MNSIGVEYLRAFFAWFSPWLWEASWQSTLLAGVVVVIQWILKKQLSARWRNALWLLVLARLLLPALPHARFSAYNWLPLQKRAAPLAITDTPRSPSPKVRATFSGARLTVPPEALPSEPGMLPTPGLTASSKPSNPWPVLPLIWMAGCLTISAQTIATYLRLGKRVKRLRADAPDALMKQFLEAKAELKVNRAELIVSEAVSAPYVTGLWTTRIILPLHLEEKLSPEDIRMVLLHELAHAKRGDLWMTWLSWLAVTLHWFNPFIRYALTLARRDREMACDEWVLRIVSDAKAYGAALIRFMELNQAPMPATSFGAIGIFENKTALVQRIRRIATYRRPDFLASVIGFAVLTGVGLFTLTKAEPASAIGIAVQPAAPPATATAILDAAAAAQLAASLANAEAKRQFDETPFKPAQDTPTFAEGRWSWRATVGYGKGDLHAVVSFTATGAKPEVRVQTLILAQPIPR